jgi:hypothetical protein
VFELDASDGRGSTMKCHFEDRPIPSRVLLVRRKSDQTDRCHVELEWKVAESNTRHLLVCETEGLPFAELAFSRGTLTERLVEIDSCANTAILR